MNVLTKYNTQDQYHTLMKIFTVFLHIVFVKAAFCAENLNTFQILHSTLHTVNTVNAFVETNESIQHIKYSKLFQSWTAVSGYKKSAGVVHLVGYILL